MEWQETVRRIIWMIWLPKHKQTANQWKLWSFVKQSRDNKDTRFSGPLRIIILCLIDVLCSWMQNNHPALNLSSYRFFQLHHAAPEKGACSRPIFFYIYIGKINWHFLPKELSNFSPPKQHKKKENHFHTQKQQKQNAKFSLWATTTNGSKAANERWKCNQSGRKFGPVDNFDWHFLFFAFACPRPYQAQHLPRRKLCWVV